MKKIVFSLIAASSILMANSEIELNLNSNTLEVAGSLYLNDTYDVSNDANYYGIISYLSSEDDNNISSKQKIVSGGLKLLNPFVNDRGLSLGLGIKAVVASNIFDGKSFLATPLSLYAKYELSEDIHFDIAYSYAPKTLSYADAKTYNEFNIKANYKILENGYMFIGARNIETTYDTDIKFTYDNTMFFGYKVQF